MTFVAVVTIALALSAAAQYARPAMKLDDFRRSLDDSASVPTPNAPSPTNDRSSDGSVGYRPVRPLIFIPGFQGTILSHESKPLFLAPMTTSTWQDTYEHLRTATRLNVTLPNAVEYPAATCAPSPFSHVGHCAPLPALGPIQTLFEWLETLGYKREQSLHAVGYDWRYGILKILHDTSFTDDLARVIENSTSPVLLVAHGYGCPLTSAFLSERPASWCRRHVSRVVCAAAPLRGSLSAEAATRDGQGFLTAGVAHHYAGAAVNVRQKGRLDFRSMEFELGLRRGTRRDHLPDVSGPWDDKDDLLAAPLHERKRLAATFESLREMSAGIRTNKANAPVTCVVGIGVPVGGADGDGVVERGSADGCREWEDAELEIVQAGHFNLTALVGDVIESLLREARDSR